MSQSAPVSQVQPSTSSEATEPLFSEHDDCDNDVFSMKVPSHVPFGSNNEEMCHCASATGNDSGEHIPRSEMNGEADNFGSADTELPINVQYRRDISADGVSLGTRLMQLTHLYNPVYFALKVASIVTLPMTIIAYTPSSSPHLQAAGGLLTSIANTNTRLYCGEQFSNSVQVIQGAFWVLVWGSITTALNVVSNEAAWWGLTFAAIVGIAFFPNLRSKRILMSYTLVIMQMQRMPGGNSIQRPSDMCACILLTAAVDMFQSVFPFPLLNSYKADRTFAAAWNEVGAVAKQLQRGVWSGGALKTYLGTAQVACNDLAAVVDDLPGMLYLSMYEPFERSLYNQLRNVRLTVLKRLLSILYSSCSAANYMLSLMEVHPLECDEAWRDSLSLAVGEYLSALQDTLSALGTTLDPAKTVERCDFARLQHKKDAMVIALHYCLRATCENISDASRASLYYSFVHFHMLLALLSEELHTFSERMEHFDPSKYKSTWRRALEFFVLDFVDDFRNELPKRLSLRNSASKRCLMDGIKMACAYSVAAAFTTRLNSDNLDDTYYFGMSIILGIGMPTASESVEIGIHRITGMTFAIAVAYLAYWKTQTYVQALAVVACGVFIATCFRSSTRYTHVGWYAASTSPAAYGIAHNRNTLVARIVDNSFAVLSYFLICTYMFAVNSFRVLWNKRAIVNKNLADAISLLSSAAQLPISPETLDIAEARLSLAQSYISVASKTLPDARSWANVCAKEVVGVGRPFPLSNVRAMQDLLSNTAASMQVWQLGLQMLHRARRRPPHPLVVRMAAEIAPVLRDLDMFSRAVFQDLIDCVQLSMHWNPEQSLNHFVAFAAVRRRVTTVFRALHKDMTEALSAVVRTKAYGSLDNFEINNRSFIGVSALQASPDNMRVVEDSGVPYETRPVDLNRRSNESDDTNAQTAAVEMACSKDVHTTYTSTIGSRPPPLSVISYRAPFGELPLDVDVTALLFIVMSANAIIHTIEKMIPHMNMVNKFERSRRTKASCSVYEFYKCPPRYSSTQ